jgi:hypothetical protein
MAHKVGAERGDRVSGWRDVGVIGFGTLMSVRVQFSCCSGGYLSQGLQRDKVMYGWYKRLIDGW